MISLLFAELKLGYLAAGLVRVLFAPGLLTDAWHLDDLHRSRPECRRTELSPDEFILRDRSGLGYKYVERRMIRWYC